MPWPESSPLPCWTALGLCGQHQVLESALLRLLIGPSKQELGTCSSSWGLSCPEWTLEHFLQAQPGAPGGQFAEPIRTIYTRRAKYFLSPGHSRPLHTACFAIGHYLETQREL